MSELTFFSFLTEPEKNFLDHFPDDRRSSIVNKFLDVIRQTGATGAEEVVNQVRNRARLRLALRRADPTNRGDWGALLDALDADPEGARRLAEHYLERERLPRSERERYKAELADLFRRAWLKEQPPTDRQVAYLRSLGWQENIPNRQAASDFIDRLGAGKESSA